ncbi:MAG: methyl-accepting chemotaxis protein [Candidatus Tectimicrobiota bacterium]
MRWTIATKLYGLSGLGMGLVILVGGVGYSGIERLQSGIEQITTTNALLRNHLEGDMMHDALRADVLAALLAETQEARQTVGSDLHKHAARFRKVLQENTTLVSTPAVQQALADVAPILTTYIASAEASVALAGQDRHAALARLPAFVEAFETLEERMEQLSDHIEESARTAQTEAKRATATARSTMVSMALGALVLLTLTALLLTRAITRPLGRTVAMLQDIAQGEGDLSRRLPLTGKDELSDLSHGFNTFMDKLHEIIAQVSGTAQHMATASAQLSATAVQLSSGAQAQAASLEETAASLEQLTGTVKHNAENARQAEHLALRSQHTAEQNGSVVSEAVTSMETLTVSAQRITEITSVINTLAFQSNLLALNASVEAARAGEHGRGFAVVADEVRKLAQRSADAANEIGGLIRESGQQVVVGADLVHKAGQAFQEIVGSVCHVSTMVAEIATASQEQASGLEQVNKAVTQMDQVTQTNAAQTEALSATARSLAQQATLLQNLVGRFQLGRASAMPPALPASLQPERACLPGATPRQGRTHSQVLAR